MYKSDELKEKFLTEIKRTEFGFEDKAKSLRQARKLLKGKDNSTARMALNEELKRIRFELGSLQDLESKLNAFEE